MAVADGRDRLGELARLFLWLGIVGFGGPAAHLALMEEQVVRRRGWLTPSEFVDFVGLTNLIPGPNSTEMALAVGYRRAGLPGLLTSGISFIVPAAAMTTALAWVYIRYGALPGVVFLLSGTGPAVIAVMALGIVRLGRTAVVRWQQLAIAGNGDRPVRCGASIRSPCSQAAAILGLGLGPRAVAAATLVVTMGEQSVVRALQAVRTISTSATGAHPSLAALGGFFLEVGSVLYGSGYVLIAFLQRLVSPLGWLSARQLADAVAAGQITPGPVFTTATFVGYVIDGCGGALVATVAIFLPAFVLVALLERSPRWGISPRLRGFLDAVNAASVGLLAAATVQLAAQWLEQALHIPGGRRRPHRRTDGRRRGLDDPRRSGHRVLTGTLNCVTRQSTNLI